MAVSVNDVMKVIQFIANQLEDVVPAYGEDDMENLKREIKLVESLLKRANESQNATELQAQLQEHDVAEDLKAIQEELLRKVHCPVAYNAGFGWDQPLVFCIQHPADSPVKDAFKKSGRETKIAATGKGGLAWRFATPLAPLLGLLVGAAEASSYNSHKIDCSKRLEGLLRKMEMVHKAMDSIINMDTNEMVRSMKK